MTNYIERWCTPWVEQVIVAAENALAAETPPPTEPDQLAVHTIHKTIAKVSRIQHDFIHVLVRTVVGGVDSWVGKIWIAKNIRIVARDQ